MQGKQKKKQTDPFISNLGKNQVINDNKSK